MVQVLGHRPDHPAERVGQSSASEGIRLALCPTDSDASNPNRKAAPRLWPTYEDDRHHQVAEQPLPPAHPDAQARAAGPDAGFGPRRAGPAGGFACSSTAGWLNRNASALTGYISYMGYMVAKTSDAER